jgi:aminoglycoside phosphotransferase (APT) family kinase protein
MPVMSPCLAESWFHQRRRLFYPKADMPVPDDLLRGLLSRRFVELGMTPERVAIAAGAALGFAPTAVSALEQQGTFHRVFRISTTGHEGRWILRANAAGDFLHDLTFHLDAWAGARVKDEDVPAVIVRHVDLSRTVVPFDFQVADQSSGVTLDRYNDDEPRMRRLLHQLGRVVAQIHGIPLSGYGLLDARRPASGIGPPRGAWNTWAEYIRLNLDAHLDACTRWGDLTLVGAGVLRSAFERHDDCLNLSSGSLLHGDLGSHNVLTDGERLLGLIDWEDALAGDPVFDIASWATFQPAARHADFVRGYSEVKPLPGDFWVRFWLYFARIAVAKAVVRRRFGYPDRPGWTTAAQRIQHAVENLSRAGRATTPAVATARPGYKPIPLDEPC